VCLEITETTEATWTASAHAFQRGDQVQLRRDGRLYERKGVIMGPPDSRGRYTVQPIPGVRTELLHGSELVPAKDAKGRVLPPMEPWPAARFK
jgi:hypothetical protein